MLKRMEKAANQQVIQKIYSRKNIKHGDYKNELFNKQQIYHKMKTIRSTNYLLGCFKLNKVSLKCFDD